MTVYVETNFLLELAFEQGQSGECVNLLGLAEVGRITLFFPAYCISECIDKLSRRKSLRLELKKNLRGVIDELGKSTTTAPLSDQLGLLTTSLINVAEEDERRYNTCLPRLLACATVIPLDATIIRQSLDIGTDYDLKPPDALILASILSHLAATTPATSLHINKNTKDFETPDIIAALTALGCLLKPTFTAGLAYLNAHLPPPP
ncbi:MAG: hypothetical protein C0501_06390 [Isosphaera sp.]|nr:hypothetical protein [Isosphaera sp.]